jgi:hypothetical protein
MLILVGIMVLCLVGGLFEAWNGHLGRCALLLAVGMGIAGYVILHAFVPGARN